MLRIILFLVLFCTAFAGPQSASGLFDSNSQWSVYFSPKGGCTEAIVARIQTAKRSIRMLSYSFTSRPIIAAIIDAKKRGLEIVIVVDKSQINAKESAVNLLHEAEIPVYIDMQHRIAHSKIIIYDNETISTGSFNFTKAAEERNSENLLFIKNETLVKIYLDNLTEHRQHSEKFISY